MLDSSQIDVVEWRSQSETSYLGKSIRGPSGTRRRKGMARKEVCVHVCVLAGQGIGGEGEQGRKARWGPAECISFHAEHNRCWLTVVLSLHCNNE